MFQADGSTLSVARYIIANTDEETQRFESNDAAAAAALGLTVRTYRDALRRLSRLNVVFREELKTGPTKGGEERVRVCLLNAAHPFWMLAMAADEMAGWRR